MQDRKHVEGNNKNLNADKEIKQKSSVPGDKSRTEGQPDRDRQTSTDRSDRR